VKRVIPSFLSDQMSSQSEEINIWVPATVVALAVSLLGSCLWFCICFFCKRRFRTIWDPFFPSHQSEEGLDRREVINSPNDFLINLPNQNDVEQRYLEVNRIIGVFMKSPIVMEELRSSGSVQPGGHSISIEEPTSSSNVNTIGPTHETTDMVGTHHDSEGRVSVAKGPVRSPDIVQPGGHSIINEELASSSNVNTIGPTRETIDMVGTDPDSEGRVSVAKGPVKSPDILQPGGHSSINEEPARSSNVNTIAPTHETMDKVGTHHDSEGRVSVAKGPVRSPDIVQPGGHSSVNEEVASSSNVNTIGPTHDKIIELPKTHHDSEGKVSLMDFTSQYVEDNITFENSNTFGHNVTIRSSKVSNLEHVDAAPSTQSYNKEASNSGSSRFTCNNPLEPDNSPYAHMDSTPSSSSSSSMFTATFYLPGSVPGSFVSHVKERLKNIANRPICQWKSSVVLQGWLPADPVVLAKAVKLLKDCVQVDKSCTLQLGTWGILYFKGTSFTSFTLTFILLHYL